MYQLNTMWLWINFALTSTSSLSGHQFHDFFNQHTEIIYLGPDYKQLSDEIFLYIRNNQGRGKCYQPSRRPRLIPWFFRISQNPNLIIVVLYIIEMEIRINTESHEIQFNVALGNRALRAQPTLQPQIV